MLSVLKLQLIDLQSFVFYLSATFIFRKGLFFFIPLCSSQNKYRNLAELLR